MLSYLGLFHRTSYSYIIDQKYTQWLLLYRQEQQFHRFGVDISRQNMTNWIIHGANCWLAPLYQSLREYMLQKPSFTLTKPRCRCCTRMDGRQQANRFLRKQTSSKHLGGRFYYHLSPLAIPVILSPA